MRKKLSLFFWNLSGRLIDIAKWIHPQKRIIKSTVVQIAPGTVIIANIDNHEFRAGEKILIFKL